MQRYAINEISAYLLKMICNGQLVRLIGIKGDDVGDSQAAESHPLPRNNDFRGVQRSARQSSLVDGLQSRGDLHDQRPHLVLGQHRPCRHCACHRALVAEGTGVPAKRIRVPVPPSAVQVLRRGREILGQQRLRSGVVIVN